VLHLRLSLHRHAAVEGNGVEGVGKSVLHVLLEINTTGRASAVVASVVVASRAAHVAGRSGRVTRRHTGDGAHVVIAILGGRGIAIGGILIAIAIGHGGIGVIVVTRHDDQVMMWGGG
jgi:hypothetical protein